jgi:hypothetical protein
MGGYKSGNEYPSPEHIKRFSEIAIGLEKNERSYFVITDVSECLGVPRIDLKKEKNYLSFGKVRFDWKKIPNDLESVHPLVEIAEGAVFQLCFIKIGMEILKRRKTVNLGVLFHPHSAEPALVLEASKNYVVIAPMKKSVKEEFKNLIKLEEIIARIPRKLQKWRESVKKNDFAL